MSQRTSLLTAAGHLVVAAALLACASAESETRGEIARSAVAYEEGDVSAPVHVVYFDDYVCDDCARFSKEAVEPLRTQWVATKRARLTVVDLAWHRGSVAGSAAAWCAAKQGKFWEMHDALFARQEVWKRAVDIPAALVVYAGEMGMDTASFARCASDKSHQRRLDEAEDVTRKFAVRGTPAFVVNGKLYYGSQSWSWVEQVLRAHEAGRPQDAPPPPLKIPKKSVVDSEKLKALEDSIAKAKAGV